jgi:tetraacyldisaccharide 4'-kinase
MDSARPGARRPAIERLWYSSGAGSPLVEALAPVSAIYSCALALNLRVWRRLAACAPIPIISVGNLTVGGNGKTPFTLFLASLLRERGLRTAIVSRGYGRKRARAAIVSDGARMRMDAGEAGDEPAMMAKSFAGPIAVARRRIDAISRLMRRAPLDAAILDDGFQHLRLRRDLDLLLVSESRGFGNGRVLPAGPMREPLSAIARADAVILMADGDAIGLAPAHRAALARRPLFRAAIAPSAMIRASGGEWIESPLDLRGRRVSLVSGLAHPEGFRSMVRALGAEIVVAIDYPDHHDYGPGDWENIMAAARRADFVLTTEKDLVKLERFSPAGFSLYALRLKVTMDADDEARLIEMALKAIRRRKAGLSASPKEK